MNTLQFTYEMRTVFANPVWDHHYTLKCMPQSDERQRIENLQVTVAPEGIRTEQADSFGNRILIGSIPEAHDSFSVSVSGTAVTGLTEREAVKDPFRLGSFRAFSPCSRPGEGLKQYFSVLQTEREDTNFKKAMCIMERLSGDFRYSKGITTIHTTAEEAWNLGGGVCQDWCHIMLTLCRMAGIPCRYVVGMLVGEGYSHAWVEIEDQGYWYAMDPTNHIMAGESHIKISCGRDYHDTVINKGIYRGSAGEQQQIRVCVAAV